jgi:hypothetical protein
VQEQQAPTSWAHVVDMACTKKGDEGGHAVVVGDEDAIRRLLGQALDLEPHQAAMLRLVMVYMCHIPCLLACSLYEL